MSNGLIGQSFDGGVSASNLKPKNELPLERPPQPGELLLLQPQLNKTLKIEGR
jgi:hypothetical protein